MKTPPLPKTVKVGVYDYAVQVLDPEIAKELDIHGDIDHTQLTIRIDTTAGYRLAAATLDHEIAHAACHQGGATARITERVLLWANVSDRLEESKFLAKLEDLVIEQVVEAMHAYRRDNPDVVRWIDRGLIRG